MLTEAKFFYNAWDGNRWHKRLLREGESVVLLYEDWPSPCVTGNTGDTYVTEENKNHEWRIFVNEQTGLDEKTKITECSPITLWQTDGEKVEAVTNFIFLGSKITVGSDCSHEI